MLLILAGGTFAAYTLKTDTVTDMKSEVLSSTSVQVSAESRNGSGMEVVCATAAGEVNREPLRNGTATFTGLEPSTAYSFTLESTEGKLLLGGKLAQAQTKQMTSLTAFQTSALSATTADLVIRGTGDQPESWVVTCTADNGDVITASGNDATKPIHVEGLTPETKYTATIARSDGDALGGTTTCEFTTQYYTVLGEFEASEITPDSATVRWLYSGTVPDAWTVTCEGSDGTSTTQDVSGTECTVDGLTGGVTYNFTLSCPSLQATDLSSISVNIPSVTITEIAAVENEDGDIEVTWEYESKDAPAQWNISYVYNAENEATPSLATSDSNSVTLTDLIPNCEYTIVVESADDFPVGGSTEITCLTSEADPFTDYGCTDTSMTLYAVESGVDEDVTTFTTDQHIGFKIQATYDVTDEDKNVKTLYLIRNADGLPVYVYRNDDPGRSWSGSWVTARHTGDLPDMPQTPGTYTLEVYFDGGFMASAEFTVEAGLGTPPEETAEEGGEEGAEEAAEEGGEDGAEEAAEEGGEEGAEESGGIAAP